jgi:hypothetical protein
LRPEKVLSYRAAKSRTQAFTLWTLHQDDQGHQKRDQDPQAQEHSDQNRHRDGNMAEAGAESNAQRSTFNAQRFNHYSPIER